MGKVTVLIVLSILTLSFTPFEKESDESVKGRENYAKGEMDKASEQFSKAAERLKNNAEAYYDLGNSRLKKGDSEGALEAYKKSLETGSAGRDLKSKIFHNMGNAMAGLKKLTDAEKYYIRSLIEKPQADTAENLEVVRRMIAQQQQQQQENKDQQEQKKEDQQQEQQQENKDQQDDQQKAGQDGKKDVEKEAASAEEKKDEESEAASAEEKKDKDEKKEDRKDVLKQFDQRKNLQISPFMLKKESDSQNGQTW